MDEVAVIQSLTSCTLEEATRAFSQYKTVVDAVDHLLPASTKPADKHIPTVAFATHLDPEQAARCESGRKLMDALTVSSVYHPQIQPSPSVEEVGMQALRLGHDETAPSAPAVPCQEQLDSPVQTPPPETQSDSLP